MNIEEARVAESGFDIWIDPGNASVECIQDLLESISDVHRAAGGTGLRFVPDRDEVLVFEEVN